MKNAAFVHLPGVREKESERKVKSISEVSVIFLRKERARQDRRITIHYLESERESENVKERA